MIFHSFLSEIQSVINVKEIEHLAGLPQWTLSGHFWGNENQLLDKKYFAPIISVLCSKFGCLLLNGWLIQNHPTKEQCLVAILAEDVLIASPSEYTFDEINELFS